MKIAQWIFILMMCMSFRAVADSEDGDQQPKDIREPGAKDCPKTPPRTCEMPKKPESCGENPSCPDKESKASADEGDKYAKEASDTPDKTDTTGSDTKDSKTLAKEAADEGDKHRSAAKAYSKASTSYARRCEGSGGGGSCDEYRNLLSQYYKCLACQETARQKADAILAGQTDIPGAIDLSNALDAGTERRPPVAPTTPTDYNQPASPIGDKPVGERDPSDPTLTNPSYSGDPVSTTGGATDPGSAAPAAPDPTWRFAENPSDTTALPVYASPAPSGGCAPSGAAVSCSRTAIDTLLGGSAESRPQLASHGSYLPTSTEQPARAFGPTSGFQTASVPSNGTALLGMPRKGFSESSYSATLRSMTMSTIYGGGSSGRNSGSHADSSYSPSSLSTYSSSLPNSGKSVATAVTKPASSRAPASLTVATVAAGIAKNPVLRAGKGQVDRLATPTFSVFSKIEVHSISNETLLKGIPLFQFRSR